MRFSCAFLGVLLITVCLGQVAGDFQSVQDGDWTSSSTWEQYDGTTWNSTSLYPDYRDSSVYIRNGHEVRVNSTSSTKDSVKNIVVDAGGTLYANTGTNKYLFVFGDVTNSGTIGGASDGMSFHIEGTTCKMSGSGSFELSRINKEDNINTTSTLTIDTTVNLHYPGTALYNNKFSTLNVVINEGDTLNITRGDMSIDGIKGAGSTNIGGKITVNGVVDVSRAVFATTNNTTTSKACSLVVGSTGHLIIGDSIIAEESGTGTFTFQIASNGKMTLLGTDSIFKRFSLTNNNWLIDANSTIEYAASGQQYIENDIDYGNLVFSGSGDKDAIGDLTINGGLKIESGPVLDVTTNNYDIDLVGNWISNNQTSLVDFKCEEGTVNFNGTIAQTIIDSNSRDSFYNVELNNTNGLILMYGGMLVNNSFTFTNGLVYSTASSIFRMKDAATFSGTASDSKHISGPMQWEHNGAGEVVFPIGDNGHLGQMSLDPDDIYSGSAKRVFTAEYDSSGYGTFTLDGNSNLNHVSYLEHWDIDVGPGGISVADKESIIKLWYTSYSEVGVSSTVPDSLAIAHFDGTDWYETVSGTTGGAHTDFTTNTTNKTVKSMDLWSDFSPFTLATFHANNPLPVDLIHAEVFCVDGNTVIKWSTATEINNERFDIYYSNDGNRYSKVGEVLGSNHSSSVLHYQWEGNGYLNGYFKLFQVDYDGVQKDLVVLDNCESKHQFIWSYIRNGVEINRVLNNKPMFIIDLLGKRTVDLKKHHDLSHLRNGIYLLQLADNSYIKLQLQ